MSYTRKVAYSTAAQMVGKAVGIGVSLITVGSLFRYLGVEGVGRYTTIFAFVSFFSVFADFGLQWTLIRELSVRKNKDKVFKNVFALRFLFAFTIFLLAFAMVWLFDYPIDVKYGVGVITLSWFFTTMNSVFVGVFQNNFRLDLSVLTDVIGRVVILVFVLVFIRQELGLNILLFAYVFGTFINFLCNMYLARRYVELGLKMDLKYWPILISQAAPIGIVLVFHFIYVKIDSLMLSMMKGMFDVGIYGVSYKFIEVIDSVPVMFLGAAFPLITRYALEKDKRLKSAFQKQFDFLSLIGLPMIAGTYVLAEPIINILGGTSGGFSRASTVSIFGNPATSVTCLRILIFAIGFSFFSSLYAFMVISIGKQNKMIWPTISFALINIVLNLILIPTTSYVGSSFSTLLTEAIVLYVTIRVTMKYVDTPVKLTSFSKVALCALLMAVAIYLFKSLGISFYINAIIAIAIYIGLVIVTKAIPTDLIKSVIWRT